LIKKNYSKILPNESMQQMHFNRFISEGNL